MSTTISARRISSRALLASLLLGAAARAEVLHVPGDFETIQAAVDAAAAGDEIVVSAGTYAEDVLVSGKSDLRLRGQGKVFVAGSGADESRVKVVDSLDIVVERLIIHAAHLDGIAIENSDRTIVRRCSIDASSGAGMSVKDSSDVLVEHVLIDASDGNGFFFSSGDRLTLRLSTITGGDDDSLNVLDGTGHLIERVSILDAGSDAVSLGADVSAGILKRCVIEDCAGVALTSVASSTLIEDNRILDPGEEGFELAGGDGCLLRRNRIVRSGSSGIVVTGGAHQFLDNRIVKPAQEAFFVISASGQLITGTRITGALDDGFVLTDDTDSCTLEDNRVSSTVAYGFIVLGEQNAVVGNRVKGAAQDGFFLSGTGNLVAGNRAKGSGGFDLNDDSGGNTYVDNDFGTTNFL